MEDSEARRIHAQIVRPVFPILITYKIVFSDKHFNHFHTRHLWSSIKMLEGSYTWSFIVVTMPKYYFHHMAHWLHITSHHKADMPNHHKQATLTRVGQASIPMSHSRSLQPSEQTYSTTLYRKHTSIIKDYHFKNNNKKYFQTVKWVTHHPHETLTWIKKLYTPTSLQYSKMVNRA